MTGSLPSLIEFYDEHIDQRDRYQILTFNLDEEIGSISELDARLDPIAKSVWDGRSLPFPTLVDGTSRTKRNFGVGSYPSVVLINPDGHVVKGGSLEMLKEKLAVTDGQP